MVRREGDELWYRCPACGDSRKHRHKAHFSVNLKKGVFYCFRCGYSGREWVPPIEQVVFPQRVPLSLDEMIQSLVPGPGSSRPSLLERYHAVISGQLVDAFILRDPKGHEIGLHFRKGRASLTLGQRGLLYPGSQLIHSRVRLVEGPYDVVSPEDVALCGWPSKRQLQMLRSYDLILCPDGDVWAQEESCDRYCRLFRGLRVSWIEVLPPGLDPDQVPPEKRKRCTMEELYAQSNHGNRGACGLRENLFSPRVGPVEGSAADLSLPH